jgi:hypothetical protein
MHNLGFVHADIKGVSPDLLIPLPSGQDDITLTPRFVRPAQCPHRRPAPCTPY